MDDLWGSGPDLELNNAPLFVAASGDPQLVPDDRGWRNTAILGPNGSGKSTLIRLLTFDEVRSPRPTHAGAAALCRERWDVAELRSSLGVVTGDSMRASESASLGAE